MQIRLSIPWFRRVPKLAFTCQTGNALLLQPVVIDFVKSNHVRNTKNHRQPVNELFLPPFSMISRRADATRLPPHDRSLEHATDHKTMPPERAAPQGARV